MKRTACLRSLITTDAGMAGFMKKKYMSENKAAFVARPDAQDHEALNMVVEAVHKDISQAEARGVAGVMTYSAAVSIFCDLKRPKYAALLWAKMQALGHSPGIPTYNALLSCHARSGDLKAFHSVWRRLLASGLGWHREPLVFCTLFAGFSKASLDHVKGKLDSVFRAAQACLPEPLDIRVIEAYVHALPSIGTADAMQLADVHAPSGLRQVRVHTAMLKPCAKCGNVQLATLLWPRIDRAHRSRSAWSWFLQAHAVAEIKQYKDTPAGLNTGTYPSAKSIFNDMRTARMTPLPGALAAVVETSRTAKEAEAFFQYCLVTYPGAVNILVRIALLNQYVRAGDWNRVAALYHKFPGIGNSKRGIEIKRQLQSIQECPDKEAANRDAHRLGSSGPRFREVDAASFVDPRRSQTCGPEAGLVT